MSSSLGGASFYADFGALGALKQGVKSSNPQALRAAAQQFESLFTDMMLKAMRAAKLGDGLGESDETDFYQDMYDQQLALQMSQGKGLGLADLLVQQLTRSRADASGATSTGASAGSANASGASPDARAADTTTRSQRSTGVAHGAAATAASGVAPTGIPNGAHSGRTGGISRQRRIGFVRMLEPYAQQAGAQLGVSADSLIAQAALETGWGQRMPSSAGRSSNNLFGVKAGGAFSGQVAHASTTEYAGGAARTSVQDFRSYGSVQQGVTDYVALLQARASYQGALGTGSDVAAFASALQRGGYATDPHYAAKLSATAAAVRALWQSVEDGGLKVAAERPTTSGVDPA